MGEDLLLPAFRAFRRSQKSGARVKLADDLVEEATAEQRALLEFSATQARGHRDVIARFGRHPHRNEVLGRESSPNELDYLASGKLVHTRPIPQR